MPELRESVAIAASAAVACLTYARLYFGIDLTDESFYTAVPYRFALGARPLVDETNVAQLTPGVLLYPFVKLYVTVVGLNGIILYTRHLYFFFCVGIGLTLFVALKRCLLDKALGAVIAAAAVAFVPFSIYGLSYNTFASGFFAAGCFLGVAWLVDHGRRLLAVAGTAHGLAMFTYPPLVLPVACFFGALYLASHPRLLRALAPGLLPALVGGFAMLAFFLQDGIGTARQLFQRAATYGGQGGGFGKGFDVASSVLKSFPHPYVAAALAVAAVGLHRLRPWMTIAAVLALPLTALPSDFGTSASANEFVANLALLAPAMFILTPRDLLAKRLMWVVWLPSAIAGEVTAVTSGNGSINFAIGSFPAAIATGALAALVIRKALPGRMPASARAILALAPALVVLGADVALQYSFVYRDGSLSHLTSRVQGGAYAGIYTTARKREFLVRLNLDLRAVSSPRCGILFYDSFPAGYLLGDGRPETNTALLLGLAGHRVADYEGVLLAYFARRDTLPDVVVRIDRTPVSDTTFSTQTYQASDPLERLFGGRRYTTVRARGDYRIMRRVDASCS